MDPINRPIPPAERQRYLRTIVREDMFAGPARTVNWDHVAGPGTVAMARQFCPGFARKVVNASDEEIWTAIKAVRASQIAA